MQSPIRILYLAPCWPTEGLSGWQLRTFQILRVLQEFGRLDCIVVTQHDDRLAGSDANGLSCVQRVVKLQPVEPRSIWNRLRSNLG
ncbi:MAG TPA: hypothetical protein VMA13_06870, partial [Candidatus Saccharimonadales bacterium]|nr:hypothetical protein [Candidatus Saccharimonadales bacterium]